VKPLFIGQAPGPSALEVRRSNRGKRIGGRALAGAAGERLASLGGLASVDDFLARVDTVNVLVEYPGPAPQKGDAFPMPGATRRARVLRYEHAHRDQIVLVGIAVARAFGFDDPPLCEWMIDVIAFDKEIQWAVIPHPSGVNRWWNDPINKALAEVFLHSLFDDAKKRRATR